MSKMICCGAASLAVCVALMTPACSVPQTTTPVRSAAKDSSQDEKLYTDELLNLIDESTTIVDRYDFDDAMLEYTKAIQKSGDLLTSNDTTQKDINEAVKEITRLRDVVTAEQRDVEFDENAKPLPAYQEMVDSIDAHIGQTFRVTGRVTHFSGGFRGTDYWVFVFWDESETNGEVAAIRIPYKSFHGIKHNKFDGVCTLEGLSDDGYPQFVCDTYMTDD